jgi:hypothetical protein
VLGTILVVAAANVLNMYLERRPPPGAARGPRARDLRPRLHATEAAYDGIAARGRRCRSHPAADRMDRGHGKHRRSRVGPVRHPVPVASAALSRDRAGAPALPRPAADRGLGPWPTEHAPSVRLRDPRQQTAPRRRPRAALLPSG